MQPQNIEKLAKQLNIAIFASGGGSNAQAIMDHFKDSSIARVNLVVSNNKDAGVLGRAEKMGVSSYVHSKNEQETDQILNVLNEFDIDFIVLAGYMKKIGSSLLAAYPNKMVNIHPALLPKFGGKGMYGMNVHKAVVEAGESVSGPTIHYVNDHYDEGTIIEQHEVQLEPSDSAEEVAGKVLRLEHKYYPPAIERIIKEL